MLPTFAVLVEYFLEVELRDGGDVVTFLAPLLYLRLLRRSWIVADDDDIHTLADAFFG